MSKYNTTESFYVCKIFSVDLPSRYYKMGDKTLEDIKRIFLTELHNENLLSSKKIFSLDDNIEAFSEDVKVSKKCIPKTLNENTWEWE